MGNGVHLINIYITISFHFNVDIYLITTLNDFYSELE